MIADVRNTSCLKPASCCKALFQRTRRLTSTIWKVHLALWPRATRSHGPGAHVVGDGKDISQLRERPNHCPDPQVLCAFPPQSCPFGEASAQLRGPCVGQTREDLSHKCREQIYCDSWIHGGTCASTQQSLASHSQSSRFHDARSRHHTYVNLPVGHVRGGCCSL